MEYCVIDGKKWDVLVVGLTESFNILFTENTGRTLSGKAKMSLDPIGTFYGHKVKFRRKNGHEDEYDELFDFLSKPRTDGIMIKIAHGQSTIDYEAYVSNGQRNLLNVSTSGILNWGEFEVSFTPMEAQVIADE